MTLSTSPSRLPAKLRRKRGIALVAVLWVLTLVALMAASFTRSARTELALARNQLDSAQAEALADAGVHFALRGLLHPQDNGGWSTDGTRYRWAFGGGEVIIAVQDETGKINLNGAPDSLLRALLVAAGVPERETDGLLDAILDFRDPDDLSRLHGAEDADYEAAGRPEGAKDAPFETVEELQQVLGMTPALYARLSPALTVAAGARRIDEATAPPIVLRALQGLGPGEAEEQSAGEPAREAEEATERPGEPLEVPAGPSAAPEPPDLGPDLSRAPRAVTAQDLRQSRARHVSIHATAHTESGAAFVREALVTLTREPAQPYRIEAWRQGRAEPQAAMGEAEAGQPGGSRNR